VRHIEIVMTIPVIQTDSLTLRPFTLDDTQAYYESILSDPAMMQSMPTGYPVPPQRTTAIITGINEHWETHGFGLWAVAEARTNHFLGHCGLQIMGHTTHIELTFALRQAAYEAAGAALRYAFETRNFPEILGIVYPKDRQAQPVYQRLGMRFWRKVHVYEQHLPCYRLNRQVFVPTRHKFDLTPGAQHDHAPDRT
jgi:RimJ/RimL family protein N-acetyltransferase